MVFQKLLQHYRNEHVGLQNMYTYCDIKELLNL